MRESLGPLFPWERLVIVAVRVVVHSLDVSISMVMKSLGIKLGRCLYFVLNTTKY